MSWLFSPGSCSCCTVPAAECCDVGDLPPTATLTYIIGSLGAATMEMTQFGTGYDGTEIVCDVDSVTTLHIIAGIACFTTYWSLQFSVSVYIAINEFEAVLANYVVWNYHILITNGLTQGITLNTNNIFTGSGSVECLPCFHLAFEGVNTEGQDGWSDNPQVCDGVSYPFAPPGEINLNLDLVAHCNISCPSNPDELMPASLKVTATVCDITTTLPDIFYQEISPGVFGWLWAATEVSPAVDLVAITGCASSDASWEGHTLCFQAVQLECGATPGSWPALSLGMYNVLGNFSPKSSSGFALTDTSPFDITYEFSTTEAADISGLGCCGDGMKKIYIRIYEV